MAGNNNTNNIGYDGRHVYRLVGSPVQSSPADLLLRGKRALQESSPLRLAPNTPSPSSLYWPVRAPSGDFKARPAGGRRGGGGGVMSAL